MPFILLDQWAAHIIYWRCTCKWAAREFFWAARENPYAISLRELLSEPVLQRSISPTIIQQEISSAQTPIKEEEGYAVLLT